MTNAAGHTITSTYDKLNRMTSQVDPLGQATTYEYDQIGNPTAIIDALNQRTELVYDDLDRLSQLTDPLNRVIRYTYDKVGNPIETIDPRNIATRYEYDPLDRLKQVTQNYQMGGAVNTTTNIETRYNYDAVGNLTEVIDPRNSVFHFAYDALDRLQTQQDPLGHITQNSYDAVGNLTQMVDAKNQIHTYTYDALNRAQTITRPDEFVSYSYDAVGNRLSMADNTGPTTYSYDNLYRMTQVADPLGQVVQYGYDTRGNRTSLTYPDGQVATYSYDAANRLTTVQDWDNQLTQYSYDAANRLTEMVLPNGITSTYQYDAANQLSLLTHQSPISQTPLASYAYSYDAAGNRIRAVENVYTPIFTPTAAFTATPVIGIAPLTVTFTNSSTNAAYFEWHFGDGLTKTIASLPLGGIEGGLTNTHIYTQPGLYTVTLLASNGQFTHTLTKTNYIVVISPEAFQEEDGLLTLEAEHFYDRLNGPSHTWNTRTDLPGFAGTSYMAVRPDVNAIYHTPALTDSPQLSYQLNFVTTGTYTIWLHGYVPNAAGDSVYVGLDHQTPVGLSDFTPRTWAWSNGQISGPHPAVPATLTVDTPGPHTLNVWMREDGFLLDRILLVTDTTYLPSGPGPAESNQVSQSNLVARPSHSQESLVAKAALNNPNQNQTTVALAAAPPIQPPLSPLAQQPLLMILTPLAIVAPLARSRRGRRYVGLITVMLFMLVAITTGTALANVESYYAAVDNRQSVGSSQYSVGSHQSSVVSRQSSVVSNNIHNSPFTIHHSPFSPSLLPTPYSLLPNNQSITTTYTYDNLYRLTNAAESTGQSFAYSYDTVGNRLTYQVNGSQVATYTYDAANRLSQVNDQLYSYDNNGNLLNDGRFTYSYDSANRLSQLDDGVSTLDYLYNGDGVRVATIKDGLRTDFVQDVAGPLTQVLAAREAGT
ncbi:MAG: PKD domain-containing protein, partial [Chloroflexi bacterium]|nr:PKD domain-containing protein [Chloroflexota bacterium]